MPFSILTLTLITYIPSSTFNFSVPFLSWLMVIALAGAAVVLYYVPLRALVLLVGVNKFLKQLLRPNAINNNELLDFLARVPDDENLVSGGFRTQCTS